MGEKVKIIEGARVKLVIELNIFWLSNSIVFLSKYFLLKQTKLNCFKENSL